MTPDVFFRISSISQAQDGHHIFPTLRLTLNMSSDDSVNVPSGRAVAANDELCGSMANAFEAESVSDPGMMPLSRHCLNRSVSLNDFGSAESIDSSRILKTCRHPKQQNEYDLSENEAVIFPWRKGRSQRSHASEGKCEALLLKFRTVGFSKTGFRHRPGVTLQWIGSAKLKSIATGGQGI